MNRDRKVEIAIKAASPVLTALGLVVSVLIYVDQTREEQQLIRTQSQLNERIRREQKLWDSELARYEALSSAVARVSAEAATSSVDYSAWLTAYFRHVPAISDIGAQRGLELLQIDVADLVQGRENILGNMSAENRVVASAELAQRALLNARSTLRATPVSGWP